MWKKYDKEGNKTGLKKKCKGKKKRVEKKIEKVRILEFWLLRMRVKVNKQANKAAW